MPYRKWLSWSRQIRGNRINCIIGRNRLVTSTGIARLIGHASVIQRHNILAVGITACCTFGVKVAVQVMLSLLVKFDNTPFSTAHIRSGKAIDGFGKDKGNRRRFANAAKLVSEMADAGSQGTGRTWYQPHNSPESSRSTVPALPFRSVTPVMSSVRTLRVSCVEVRLGVNVAVQVMPPSPVGQTSKVHAIWHGHVGQR